MYRFPAKSLLLSIVLGTYGIMSFGCAASTAAAATDDASGLLSDTLTVAGRAREFSYFVPGTSGQEALPIVIYLHGHGDNMRHIVGKARLKSASSVWMDVAEQERFLVLYPLGAKASGRRAKTGWNDCRDNARGNPQLDDVAFVRRLIDFATEQLNGDQRRVYVTGMSNGGHMAMRVGMDMPAEVAAIASVASLMPAAMTQCSRPTQPVPILMMHGTADPIAPFKGGSMTGGRGQVLSARETVNTWVRWNNLESVTEQTVDMPDENRRDKSVIVRRTREHASDGIAVVAYEIQGGGHTEPSRSTRLGRLQQRIQGNQNGDIEMAETIWDFFEGRAR